MLRGLYSGATAMNALTKQQELISSNLANINSNGFRRAVLSFEELREGTTDKQIGVRANKPSIDFSTGTPQQTGNPLDASISGDGFFSVQTPDGTRYTRAGSFHRDPNSGQLVNVEGFPVDGDGGPINIDPSISDREISMDTTGIFSARGLSLGKLAVTKFADNSQLIPHGQVYFEAPAGAASEVSPGEIISGSLEMSNSQPVTELINLIITSRMFEAAERSMRTISETIQLHYRA